MDRSTYSLLLSKELKSGTSSVSALHRKLMEAMHDDEYTFPVCPGRQGWIVC